MRETAQRVAALIPAYREEVHIADVVRGVLRHLPGVIVVDDGSDDATAARAQAAGAEILRHPRNLGKGAAIKTGFHALLARPIDYILLLDGDGQHRPEEIPHFLNAAAASPETILWVGNRLASPEGMPWLRLRINRWMSRTISRRLGVKVPDTQCGFRMLHRCLLPALFCESNAYEYETEMLFVTHRDGHRIGSVPVSTLYRDEKSCIRPIPDALRFLRLLRRY